MAKCPNQEKNISGCVCTYDGCLRKGLCCECVSYHRSKNQLPGCFFSPPAEQTYDRSVENFIRTRR